ncbi:hypothetical protein [Metabacillus sp. FJAT-53654]|uniref:Uncharacterized protein n=1 Tax=Metabacillus rhizosphaerae TaxID=3117747 RepID=A0ABZ2MQ30_9BACI
MNEQQRKESTQVTPTDKKSEKDYPYASLSFSLTAPRLQVTFR